MSSGAPAALDSLSIDQALAIYRRMVEIRSFEEVVAEQHQQRNIVGSVHLCIGQESIYAAAVQPLDLSVDAVFPTYRGHGWAIACGVPLKALFAELLGRQTGISGGRGGSAYFTAPDYGMWGENSIVGAGAPIATGAALAAKFDGSGRVAVASFGDGALNQGSVSEALNFAAVEKLPVIFIIENNAYSELTPISRTVVREALYTRAAAFGIPGARVDGNAPGKVVQAMSVAVERARHGGGPTVLEMTTRRTVGHYIGDQQTYRPKEELAAAKANEPIGRLRRNLLAAGANITQLNEIDDAVAQEVATALNAALADAKSDPSTVLEHLYG